MGHRRNQCEPARAIRLIECNRQRDRAAQRMSDDQGAVELHRPNRAGERRRLSANAGRTPGRARRIARARTIERDDAELGGEPVDQRMGEISHLSAKAVDQHDGRPRALVENMDPLAVEIEKPTLRRHGPLDPPRREDGEFDKPADHAESRKQRDRQPGHGSRISRARIAGYDTGASRSIAAIAFASPPTRMRRCRRSIPLTIVSPAISGASLSAALARTKAAALSSGVADFGARERSAIAVATPPGWTTVTPTGDGSSSCISALENPRTANLLAA